MRSRILEIKPNHVSATLFLYKLLGTSALFGLLGTIREERSVPPIASAHNHAVSLPLSHLASKVVIRVQDGLMKTRDQRTALMNELLQGIRMLKYVTREERELNNRFMAWERAFERRIHAIRKTELHWQARNYQIEVAFSILWGLTPVIVTVIAFLVGLMNLHS